jgi:Protein of unknown function (DUF3761)
VNFCCRRMAVKTVPLLLALGLAAAGCKDASTTASVAANDKGSAATATVPTSPAPVESRSVAPKPTTAPSHASAPKRTSALVLSSGVVLPNRTLTPGATNSAVIQATIRTTICRTGYTKTIRPSSSYTTGLKRQQLAAGYSFHGDLSTSDYEEDHLISLELGGSPSSVKNLWPEPYIAAEGARVKDKIENQLHDLVCSGRLTLRAAQRAIATNWWTAFQRYGGAGVPRVWDGTYGAASASGGTSTSGGSTSTTSGPTAQCRDGSYSYSQHRSGTCSHHGGVARWINPPPS